jgi:hypothetical protein
MPSPKLTDAFLARETQQALPRPLAVLILGAVSQVETLMELADRVCDRNFTVASARRLNALNASDSRTPSEGIAPVWLASERRSALACPAHF